MLELVELSVPVLDEFEEMLEVDEPVPLEEVVDETGVVGYCDEGVTTG